MNAYVVFSDLHGFSKLSEPEIRKLSSDVLQTVYDLVKAYITKAKVFNTWGDACFGIFENGSDAVSFCIEYRKAFQELNFSEIGIKPIKPRIAAHFGEFLVFYDKYLSRDNAIGWIINTAARIEPITKVGEIFVTKQFKDNIESLPVKIDSICFDELGTLPIAKGFGEFELYKLRLKEEKKTILDRLIKRDISDLLPEPSGLTQEEIKSIEFLKAAPNRKIFKDNLATILSTSISDEAKREIAKNCKDYGEFEEAIKLIESIESSKMKVDDFSLMPYKYNIEIAKLKANCLSRMGKYEDAASLVYGLWHMGQRDPDTLSMLAAQYKRKALFINGKIETDKANTELLNRSKDLYLEAFRLNISDYYPAINAAYLYKIIGGIEEGKGGKIAEYIIEQFSSTEHKDWWLASSLAECELVKNDYEEFVNKESENLKKYKPPIFEIVALKEQIQIFNAYYPNDFVSKFIETLLEE